MATPTFSTSQITAPTTGRRPLGKYRGRKGVFVIRDVAANNRVLYVGKSSDIADTIFRYFSEGGRIQQYGYCIHEVSVELILCDRERTATQWVLFLRQIFQPVLNIRYAQPSADYLETTQRRRHLDFYNQHSHYQGEHKTDIEQ